MAFNLFRSTKLTYIANTGVLISDGKNKVLIDALHYQADRPLATLDRQTAAHIVNAKAPFDKLSSIMFTKLDHNRFEPSLLNTLVAKNQNISVVAPYEISLKMKTLSDFTDKIASRIVPVDISENKSIKMTVQNIPMVLFSLVSESEEKSIGYLFEIGSNDFLVLGQAKADMGMFEASGIFDKKCDYVLASYTMLASDEGRDILRRLNPKCVYLYHLPDPAKDENSTAGKIQSLIKKFEGNFPETQLLSKPMQEIVVK